MSGEEKVNGVAAPVATTVADATTNGHQNNGSADEPSVVKTTGFSENGDTAKTVDVSGLAAVSVDSPDTLAAQGGDLTTKKVSSSTAPSEVGTEENYDDEDDVDPDEEQLFKSLEQKQAEDDMEEALHPSDKPKTVAAAPALLKAAIEAGEVKAEDEDVDEKKGKDNQAGVRFFLLPGLKCLCFNKVGDLAVARPRCIASPH